MSVCKAERERVRRRKVQKTREEFISNPYKFTKKTLGKAKGGMLTTPMSEIEE